MIDFSSKETFTNTYKKMLRLRYLNLGEANNAFVVVNLMISEPKSSWEENTKRSDM